jgi:PAS domain S-box-containing protein
MRAGFHTTALDQLRELTDLMDAGVTRCSRELRYEWVSRAYADWLGRPADTIIGRAIADVLGSDTFAALRPHFERVLRGERVEYETQVAVSGIGPRWIHAVYVPTFDAGGVAQGWVAVVTDVTERRRLELAMEQARADAEARLRETNALVAASRELTASLDMEELLGRICRIARDLLHADGATFVLREGEQVHYVAEDAAEPLWKGQRFDADACVSGWAIRHRETAVVADVRDDPRVSVAGYLSTFARALAMVPVPRRDPFAALGVYWAEPHAASPTEVRCAEALADIAAIAVQNARLFAEVEGASRAKDEFLAMLAHELRNPLAPIRNAAALIGLAGSGDDRVDAARAIVERQVDHLSRLVDDLLDVARITRGSISLRREIVSLREVVLAAVESARPLIEERCHSLRSDVDCDAAIEGDRERLIQVVTNLLTNAAKFTPPGGKLGIETTRKGDEVRVRVCDSGIGVSIEAQNRIFDLFRQEQTSLARSQGGLGVGLHLVKRVVEMHGGRVDVRSEGLGRGAEFCIWLPTARGVAVPAARAERRVPAAAAKLRVLLVEDHRDTAESFQMLLRIQGHEVRVVADGVEAVDVFEAWAPDVAFVDIGLPGIDGLEVARRIRPRADGRAWLVAISGYGRDVDKRRAAEAGFDRHLTKPVDLDAVVSLLADFGDARAASQFADTAARGELYARPSRTS